MAKKPTKTPNLRGATIAGKPVTPAQWQSGALGAALARGATRDGTTIRGRPLTQLQWERGDLARALFPGGLPPGVPGGPPLPPAAPAAPTGPPVDPGYDLQMGALGRQREISEAGTDVARKQGLASYGYNEDPTTGALAFDPTNPFGKAAVLKQTWDRSRRGAAQSMGAGGGLYSGAFQNTQDYVNRGELGAQDALQKSLTSFLAQNTGERAAAGTTYETGAAQAYGDRLGRVPTNPLYEKTVTPGAVPAATKPAFTTKAATGPSGAKGYWHTHPDGRRVFVKS